MSSLCPQKSSASRRTASQVVSQGKAWDQSVTVTKAHIIGTSNTELINSISIPAITHPVQQLLQDSEAIKRKFTNILSVADYIRAEDRKGQKHPSFRGRVYIACTTSSYQRRDQWRGAGRKGRRL